MNGYNEKVIIINEIKNPKISVIIPTYNEEKYIEDTLLSIKYQRFNYPYEIIVSDSNSKDKTIEIAKRYANKIIITKKRGISIGRNLGAKYAKGDILIFVDADTILLPNTLREVYKVIKKKGISLVFVPFLSREYSPISNFYFSFSFNYMKFLYIVGKVAHIPGFFMACKREDFFRVGGFDEKLKVLEDFDFSEKLSKIGKVCFVENTYVLTSSRRIKKWGTKAIPKYLASYFNYLIFKNDKIGKNFWKPIR
ncbi:MAG: glycosyltransferase [Candidatus Aenigmatarchaeota archaeon]